MRHWILGLEEDGPEERLVAWLEAQPDPEEAVKAALRFYAFGEQAGDRAPADRAPLDNPLLRQAMAALRAAVADVEAAAGIPTTTARALVAPVAAAAAPLGAEPVAPVADAVVDDKIGKLLDFDQEREEADLPLDPENGP